jgi:hypothetical protein
MSANTPSSEEIAAQEAEAKAKDLQEQLKVAEREAHRLRLIASQRAGQ